MNSATYTATIEPQENDATVALLIRKSMPKGIDGPFSEEKIIPITDIDAELNKMGFKRIENFGSYCISGYAEAEIIRI